MDVNLYGAGPNSNIEAQIDPSSQALRTSLRGIEFQSQNGPIGGHFAIATMTGTMAAGIASLAQVFQVRWADPSKLFILKSFVVQASTGTGFAATTLGAPLELIVGHGSTANGSGGSALAPTSVSNKMRNVMATTAFTTSGEIRVATTAALTAATGQTLEPAAIGACLGAPNGTLVQSSQMVLFDQRDAGDYPLILAAGDTLVVRTVTPAATGTWFATFTMDWVETVAF